MKRRDWFKTLGTAGLAGATLPFSEPLTRWAEAGSRPAGVGKENGEVRNVIFLALDGTGYEDLAAAAFFAERVLDRSLAFRELLGRSASGSMFTHSLTSVVTDSAAATSAWSTGRKVVNGSLSQLPDGRRLHTILELAREQGLATGLVTSTRITHATPAGWAAKVAHRDLEEEVAEQYLGLGVDVLLGGGAGPFESGSRADGRDLIAEARGSGYEILRTVEELEGATGSRLLGLFTPDLDHLAYEIDRRYQGEPSPSLAQVTAKALQVLDGRDRGFVLQVEAGRIDHANHQNDGAALLWDWIAADDALQVILEYVDRTPGTLLVVAADHDTGAGAVYGVGPLYSSSTAPFERVAAARGSLITLRRKLGRGATVGDMDSAVREHLGFRPSRAQAEAALRAHRGEEIYGHPNAHGTRLNSMNFVLSAMDPEKLDRPNISFATGNHTAGVVPVLTYGAGVSPGTLGAVDNTELFHWMTAAMGLAGFENPGMTESEALEWAGVPTERKGRPHWV